MQRLSAVKSIDELEQKRHRLCYYFYNNSLSLQIFYHNRFKVVDPIPVVYLDLCSNSTAARNKGRPRRLSQNSRLPVNLDIKTVSSEEFCLNARNPAQLSVPVDPEVAIVFILEYVLGEATSARRDSNSDLVRQVSTAFTVRWGSYNLFTNPEILDKEECVVKIRVPLQGTPNKFVTTGETEVNNHQSPLYTFDSYEKQLCCTFCPDGTLCFRDETKSALKFTLSGTVSIGRRPQVSAVFNHSNPRVILRLGNLLSDKIIRFLRVPSVRVICLYSTDSSAGSLTNTTSVDTNLATLLILMKYLPTQHSPWPKVSLQFLWSRSFPCVKKREAGTVMGPFVGGLSGPVFYEPIQPVPASCYALADQSSGVPLSIATRVQCGTGLSRAAYARLYSAGKLLTEGVFHLSIRYRNYSAARMVSNNFQKNMFTQ
ncbi:uncharacterized protein DEA37_0011830 [Paragonimus westermani]|uniref:Uncharacterized protein n=1 Tax=Paragonimus westermani TaxID=34504 RepID=A0A5J4NQ60_9TREM|nr:uncharacterized protein DEA37_0011830 [Paragonimus westermani]